ncbi:response regulator [Tunicatimonas pelagia]|uniref:response regulator n=1 Tax=Tunicatimonas pelagia TaxID=931531 RepID=UPI0026659768|nr:response regulator [Tunicatimonas pelagia]WKN44589.1 response regulator [Tunicatimonas pelagia]
MKTKSVLLVEDNPGDARLVREALKDSPDPLKLVVASDGQEALDMLKTLRPDIILLDLNLPKVDGRDVLKSIKSTPHLRRIPVVILSTSEAELDINNAYDAHANSYITKPLDFNQFTNIIHDIQHYWLGSCVVGPTPLN